MRILTIRHKNRDAWNAGRNRTYVVLRHFRADAIAGALHPLDGVLDLVGRRDVLPRVQEGFLLHRALFGEEDVEGRDAGEVEDVQVVLDGHLDDCEGGRGEEMREGEERRRRRGEEERRRGHSEKKI